MKIEKIKEKFINKYMTLSPYANREEIASLALEVDSLIKNNKDATPEEWLDTLIKENIREFEKTTKKYQIPGYQFALATPELKAYVSGGNSTNESLYDLNSMEMMIIDGVTCKLIEQGELSYFDKISEIDPKFVNFDEDITIGDILEFNVAMRTNGRLDEAKDPEEAMKKLYEMKGTKLDHYTYTDLGMTALKRVIEDVTGYRYVDLANELIKELGLDNMYIVVPQEKYHLIKNTPNAATGKSNDSKSIMIDPINGAGGAGTLFADSKNITDMILIAPKVIANIEDASTPKYEDIARGKKGHTFTIDEGGVDETYLSNKAQKDEYAIHGRYLTEAGGNEKGAYTVFLNAAGDLETGLIMEDELNKERVMQGKNPVKAVKNMEVKESKYMTRVYNFVDSRQYYPIEENVTENLIEVQARTMIKMKFLAEIIKEMDKEYLKDNEVKVEKVRERI